MCVMRYISRKTLNMITLNIFAEFTDGFGALSLSSFPVNLLSACFFSFVHAFLTDIKSLQKIFLT